MANLEGLGGGSGGNRGTMPGPAFGAAAGVVTARRLALFGVVLAGVAVVGGKPGRSSNALQYTLWLVLVYLLLANTQQVAQVANQLIGSVAAVVSGPSS